MSDVKKMKSEEPSIVVIIPANNECDYIDACLEAIEQQAECSGMQIIVSANACHDDTVALANAWRDKFATKGHGLICLDSPIPGKLGALNRAEECMIENGWGQCPRLYLDADIECDTDLVHQIKTALAVPEARYATGTLSVCRADTFFTRMYAKFWQTLPFVQGGAVGVGCFAVNAEGRARWKEFPSIISDDTFVRLNFKPAERVEVPALYHWPMIEGFRRLVHVRRRQDAGVVELAGLYPELMNNDGTSAVSKLGVITRAVRMPIGFAVYMAVHIAVRFAKSDGTWSRGR